MCKISKIWYRKVRVTHPLPPDMENSFLNWEGNFMRKWSCAFYLPCNFVWLMELPINFWWTDFIMMWWALIDWFWQAQIGIDLRCVAYHFGIWKISWFHEWFYYLCTCLYNAFDNMEKSYGNYQIDFLSNYQKVGKVLSSRFWFCYLVTC